MTTMRLEKRLGVLEAKPHRVGNYDHLDELSTAELEAMVISIRAQMLDAMQDHGIELPTEWDQLTERQQDLWLQAIIK